eukprot:1159766-Pelagomonas_calceolata.AAC.10
MSGAQAIIWGQQPTSSKVERALSRSRAHACHVHSDQTKLALAMSRRRAQASQRNLLYQAHAASLHLERVKQAATFDTLSSL